MTETKRKWLYLVILSIIWGSSFILIKKGLIGLSPYQLGAVRTLITGIILLIFGYKKLKNLTKQEFKWVVISGFIGSFFPAFLFAIAQTEIDSAITSVLNSLVPLNAILLGFAIFGIGFTKRQFIGVIIGFTGTSILVLRGADVNPDQNYLYAGFVIVASIMYALNANIIKRFLQDTEPLAIAAGNYVGIIIPSFIVLLVSDFFSAKTLNHPDLLMSLVFIAILSIFGTALAKIVFFRLVQISTPVFASSVTYLMPVVALIWGLVDGEEFGLLQLGATIIILFGVYLANSENKGASKS